MFGPFHIGKCSFEGVVEYISRIQALLFLADPENRVAQIYWVHPKVTLSFLKPSPAFGTCMENGGFVCNFSASQLQRNLDELMAAGNTLFTEVVWLTGGSNRHFAHFILVLDQVFKAHTVNPRTKTYIPVGSV